MKAHIAAKLSRELEDEIVSERQVVYILVETRKLLEQQATLGHYRNLKLCADWAVHPRLQGQMLTMCSRSWMLTKSHIRPRK